MIKPETVLIRRPRATEAREISALALRSKGYWGYDQAFLDDCRAELTYSAEDCDSGDLFVAESDEGLIGMGAVRGSATVGELSALFVDPTGIGHGVGGALLRHAMELARSRGIQRLLLDADPHAEPFYAHHGARKIGEVASASIPGRRLPRMELQVPNSGTT